MTRVDFYISNNQAAHSQQQIACRITEKAYQQQNNVLIYTNNAAQSQQLDEMLWVFRQGSFIPHSLDNARHAQRSPVLIGHQQLPELKPDVLINLADDVPNFFSRFGRIAEIVAGDEQQRQLARQRYKFYRERGYALETHELAS